MSAVSTSTNASKDFARALTVLVCCIKPCILLPVWTDCLGHTAVRRSGPQGKEEKKRTDKRDKKEKEDEEERLKPWMTWVRVPRKFFYRYYMVPYNSSMQDKCINEAVGTDTDTSDKLVENVDFLRQQ
jgi:nucleosome-remodeling factor subunit BPTF